MGSNDLMQFLFAVDRDNRRVSGRFDALNPAMLRALQMVARKAAHVGKPLSICGEMAGRPLEALALLAMGFRTLSMSPAAIGPIKAMVLGLNLAEASQALEAMLADCDGCATLREQLTAFAEVQGIPV